MTPTQAGVSRLHACLMLPIINYDHLSQTAHRERPVIQHILTIKQTFFPVPDSKNIGEQRNANHNGNVTDKQ